MNSSSKSNFPFRILGAGALTVLILAVYAQVLSHDFIILDDAPNIFTNPRITQGLKPENILWFFTHLFDGNWIPLNWISHLLTWTLFSNWAGGHLLINLLLHLANALLVWKLMEKLTGRERVSLGIALLFALHPLRVESVAWISERKDALSGFFFLCSLLAYVDSAQTFSLSSRPSSRDPVTLMDSGSKLGMTRKIHYHLFALLFFALGLMVKPMLVTLPVILILLDQWLLKRKFSLIQKLPFLLLSGISVFLTTTAHQDQGWIHDAAVIPFFIRIANAAFSASLYLIQTFAPFHLCVFYPYPPAHIIFLMGSLGILVLILITVLTFRLRRQAPYFITGWIWYLVMLAPVLQLISFAGFSRADRFTYLPSLGISLILGMAASDLARARAHLKPWLYAIGFGFLGILSVLSYKQVQTWKNTETVFLQALKVTPNNFVAHENLAQVYTAEEKLEKALAHYEEAARIYPNPQTLNNLATTYFRLGEKEKAKAIYEALIREDPENELAKRNLELVSNN